MMRRGADRAGGVVEGPDESPAGEVLLPAELASSWGCGDHVRLATRQADGDLRLDLAGDTLERLQALMAMWPCAVRLAASADGDVPRAGDLSASCRSMWVGNPMRGTRY